jgi:hypothetical protein
MSYPTYNTTMIGDSFNTVTGPPVTITTSNNTSNGLYWGLNGTSNTISTDPSLKGATLSVKGDADFEGEVTIKGKKLTEMFDKIEERLAILHPNPELEDRWVELKELAKRYKELEQELIEKEKVWAILKK